MNTKDIAIVLCRALSKNEDITTDDLAVLSDLVDLPIEHVIIDYKSIIEELRLEQTSMELEMIEDLKYLDDKFTGRISSDLRMLQDEIYRLRQGIRQMIEVIPQDHMNLNEYEALTMQPTKMIVYIHELLGCHNNAAG